MNRCLPGNMIMAEAVRFGQRWTYYSHHPMADMVNPEYFKAHTGIMVGDEIRIVELDEKKTEVQSFCEVLVSKVKPLQFFVTREIVEVNKNVGLKTRQGNNCWELVLDGEVIERYEDKGSAEEGLRVMSEDVKVAVNG